LKYFLEKYIWDYFRILIFFQNISFTNIYEPLQEYLMFENIFLVDRSKSRLFPLICVIH